MSKANKPVAELCPHCRSDDLHFYGDIGRETIDGTTEVTEAVYCIGCKKQCIAIYALRAIQKGTE